MKLFLCNCNFAGQIVWVTWVTMTVSAKKSNNALRVTSSKLNLSKVQSASALKEIGILLTGYIYAFHFIFRIKSDYLRKLH
jgi:hypothetical protein